MVCLFFVRELIEGMQEDTVHNNLKFKIQESAINLQTICTNIQENMHIKKVEYECESKKLQWILVV